MHSTPFRKPVLFTSLALLAVAAFGAAPANADHDDYRGRGRWKSAPAAYCPPPRPVIVHQPTYRLIPAHYETRTETICVAPARIERRWVEPSFGFRFDSCGNRIRVCVDSGHWETYTIPARYETRTVQVYVPDQYVRCDPAPVVVSAPPRYPHGHHRY